VIAQLQLIIIYNNGECRQNEPEVLPRPRPIIHYDLSVKNITHQHLNTSFISATEGIFAREN
jgi:hypothetical protein